MSRRSSFVRCFLEDQLGAFALLGFLMFFVVAAIGSWFGADLAPLVSQRSVWRRFWEFLISAVVFGVCILVPAWSPEHLSRGWQFAAIGILVLTHLVAAASTVKRWRAGTLTP